MLPRDPQIKTELYSLYVAFRGGFSFAVTALGHYGDSMLVRLKNGKVENLSPKRAEIYIRLGYADKYKPLTKDEAVLLAEKQGGDSACAGVELAIREPRADRAVITYARTRR